MIETVLIRNLSAAYSVRKEKFIFVSFLHGFQGHDMIPLKKNRSNNKPSLGQGVGDTEVRDSLSLSGPHKLRHFTLLYFTSFTRTRLIAFD
jgi:hypothetical protein